MVATFEVLAEPTRRRILDLLRDRERPVGDLVGALAVSQPTVSKHLRVLREAGLVERAHAPRPQEARQALEGGTAPVAYNADPNSGSGSVQARLVALSSIYGGEME